MFFIFGISQNRKQLKFRQTVVCPCCGRYSAVSIWMQYTYLMLFFIPVFRWNRHYYAVMDCCGAACEVSQSTGRAVERGDISSINIDDLCFRHTENPLHRCPQCGYTTAEDFRYCPKCGHPFGE
jgi:RNA polymerase subunit RPABC4/transcription elongation factor Spt4